MIFLKDYLIIFTLQNPSQTEWFSPSAWLLHSDPKLHFFLIILNVTFGFLKCCTHPKCSTKLPKQNYYLAT